MLYSYRGRTSANDAEEPRDVVSALSPGIAARNQPSIVMQGIVIETRHAPQNQIVQIFPDRVGGPGGSRE